MDARFSSMKEAHEKCTDAVINLQDALDDVLVAFKAAIFAMEALDQKHELFLKAFDDTQCFIHTMIQDISELVIAKHGRAADPNVRPAELREYLVPLMELQKEMREYWVPRVVKEKRELKSDGRHSRAADPNVRPAKVLLHPHLRKAASWPLPQLDLNTPV